MQRPSELDSDEQAKARSALLTVCTEGWRLLRSFERAALKLDVADQKRMGAQIGFFARQIAESLRTCGLRIENLEGHRFDPGLAVTALNLDEFTPDEHLVIETMLEPQLVSVDSGVVVRWGKVVLSKSAALKSDVTPIGPQKDTSNA